MQIVASNVSVAMIPSYNISTSSPVLDLPGEKISKELRHLYCSVIVFMSLAIVIGNTVVIVTVLRHDLLKIPSNYFIVSLALSDLLFGVVFAIYMFAQLTDNSLTTFFASRSACVCLIVLLQWIDMTSAYHLVAVTATRYIAITRPLMYHIYVTHTRSLAVIAFIWISTLCITVPMYTPKHEEGHVCLYELVFKHHQAIMFAVVTVIIPLLCMMSLYSVIIRIARQQILRVYPSPGGPDFSYKRYHIFFREMRSTMAVLWLIGYFTFAWTPLVVTIIYSTICKCHISPHLTMCSRLVVYANYSINIFVYAGRLRHFRKYLLKDLRSCLHIQRDCDSPTRED